MKHRIIIIIVSLLLFFLTSAAKESWLFRILAATIGGAAAYGILLLQARRKEQIRNRSYDMDLPDFMIHIAMFTEAGLNIWDAIERAAGTGSPDRPLYKDIAGAYERVRKGSAKDLMASFEELAEQRRSASLSNFCTMVIQNVRKGSGELSSFFTSQAQIYRNERRRTAGKLADEAATLLLLPSAIVLVALILLLLSPAILEMFGGF
ncbi:MAG: type II secretion system F family protein [Clostridia bacterium]